VRRLSSVLVGESEVCSLSLVELSKYLGSPFGVDLFDFEAILSFEL